MFGKGVWQWVEPRPVPGKKEERPTENNENDEYILENTCLMPNKRVLCLCWV